MRRTLSMLLPLSLALTLGASGASALIIVNFDSDPVPTNQPNGFTSADSSRIHFSDTVANDLVLINHAVVSNGSNALAVFTDNDDSALRIDFDFVANSISLDFGNDQAGASDPGDEAVLTAFLGAAQVGQVKETLNRNSLMDQSISFDGALFDAVTFKFDVNPAKGLIEVVDNIRVQPIPEPAAAICFWISSLLAGASVRRPRAVGAAES